jgi:uncharacterized protein YjbJ (UPF0337 family)
MSKEETKGKIKKEEGKIREGLGKMTGDKSEQVKGKMQQAEGTIREQVGKAKRKT